MLKSKIGFAASIILVSGCSLTKAPQQKQVDASFLANNQQLEDTQSLDANSEASPSVLQQNAGFEIITPVSLTEKRTQQGTNYLSKLSDSKNVQVSSESLPVKDFLHYVFV